MVWEVYLHRPYSPDLVPSDYHLFGFVKNQMRGQNYETNEALQTAVRQCLRAGGTELYPQGNIQTSRTVGKNVYREMGII